MFECCLRRSEQAYGEPRACRRRTRETRHAEASEAAFSAIAAKALVKTWKKPCLSPGQTCLPVELWGLVLEQLLPDDSLWDLRATVQELCNPWHGLQGPAHSCAAAWLAPVVPPVHLPVSTVLHSEGLVL